MDYLKAFLVGGAICVVGQLFIDKTRLTPARILTLFLIAGMLLAAFGLYEPIVEWAGAGATVPLSGFGYVIAEGMKKAVAQNGWLGVLTGGVTAMAAGLGSVLLFSFVAGLVTRSKSK